jgi:hypothetical protein
VWLVGGRYRLAGQPETFLYRLNLTINTHPLTGGIPVRAALCATIARLWKPVREGLNPVGLRLDRSDGYVSLTNTSTRCCAAVFNRRELPRRFGAPLTREASSPSSLDLARSGGSTPKFSHKASTAAMVATSPVLHLHRVRRLGARRVPEASTRGLKCFEVDGPITRAQPTQEDDPLLISSGPAGIFGRSDLEVGPGYGRKGP